MRIKPLFTPHPSGPMRIAGFLSGSGTNLNKILEYERKAPYRSGHKTYEVVVIFSDNPASAAREIGRKFGLPYVINDIAGFYAKRGMKDTKDLSLRREFDEKSLFMLSNFDFDLIALAGYMSIITQPILSAFSGRIVNIHPADLSIRKGKKRLYTGDQAVALAIKNGEKAIHSSTHIVREEVDYGEILMISDPVEVQLPEGITAKQLKKPEMKDELKAIADQHQEQLKEKGDWVIFPRTLELISHGRFGFDEKGGLFLDQTPIPEGYREPALS